MLGFCRATKRAELMSLVKANLIVTLPGGIMSVGALVSALAAEGNDYRINIDVSPLTTLQSINDARKRGVLRELNDWDAVSNTRPLAVIAANPYVPWGLHNFGSLRDGLALRRARLRFAACDQDTVSDLSKSLEAFGIDAANSGDILYPRVPGSAAELAKIIVNQAEKNQLSIVLEEVDEMTLVARRLITEGQRVLRLPILGRTKNPLGGFVLDQDMPNFILVNDAMSVYQAVQGIKRIDFGAREVTWVGTKPALRDMALRDAPGSSWLDVPHLRHDTILDRVSRHVA